MKNGTTPIQASICDARPGPSTRGVGVGTGGTSKSGCTDPASDEALIAQPLGNPRNGRIAGVAALPAFLALRANGARAARLARR
ncbi:hypothetical protein, partial [Paraburkholderia kirstenboschensis]|uniref:hypothetical protein n=1 Tax=Paraburkholderia kirstenboschensis TaxID=1245436 RepID=UPI001FB35A01